MDNQWTDYARSWPVLGTWDIAIAGAGPAGIAAALAAARLGQKTILVEKYGFPGGTASAGLVPNLMGFHWDNRQIVGGVGDSFVRRLGEADKARFKLAPKAHPDPEPIGDRALMHPVTTTSHGIRLIANRMLEEAGVDRLFYTRVMGAVMSDSQCDALAVDAVEGPRRVCATQFIDATGDAHLTDRAGAKTIQAPEQYGMTKTMIFQVAGVEDFDRRTANARFQELLEQDQVPLEEQDRFMGYSELHEGVVGLNFTVAHGNPLNSRELTRMDAELREQISLALDWFRNEFPGFENAWLKETPAHVGIRAGRVIHAQQTITRQDIDEQSHVEQPVALGIRRYGDHGLTRFSSPESASLPGALSIPWESLLPRSANNIIAAGRCIGIEPQVITSVRYMAQCFATGQAAGTGAALAAGANRKLKQLDYNRLKEALIAHDAILE